LDFTQAQSRL